MPEITTDGMSRVFASAVGKGDCPFIANFVKKSSPTGIEYGGLIFGIGDVILEYWSAVSLWWEFRHRMNDQAVQLFASQPAEVYRYFESTYGFHKSTGGQFAVARSNAFIAFSGQDQLKVGGSYVLSDKSEFGHNMNAKFDALVAPDRFQFYLRFKTSSDYGIEKSEVSALRRGIEKDVPGSTAHWEKDPKLSASNVTSLRQFMVRRACKFLMYDEIKERGGPIHYALDGIKTFDVANRTALELKGREIDAPKVPVCTSELRELFRLWNFFQSHTIFYRDLEMVKPLWEDPRSPEEAALWANYAKKRCKKVQERYPANDQVNQAAKKIAELLPDDALNPSNYQGILAAYHSIPWQLVGAGHTQLV